jgi:hypothetical protein
MTKEAGGHLRVQAQKLLQSFQIPQLGIDARATEIGSGRIPGLDPVFVAFDTNSDAENEAVELRQVASRQEPIDPM